MSGDLIDVRQAAREAGRSAETVRRWVWSGRLGARKQGRRLLIDRNQLHDVIQEHGTSAASSLADWMAELEEDPIYARAPHRSSASDLVLEERRDRHPSSASSRRAGR